MTRPARAARKSWQRRRLAFNADGSWRSCVTSRLLNLALYVDDNGVMRVQGRIDKDFNRKHPAILHHECKLTRALIHEAHESHHQSVEQLLAKVRGEVWITRARRVIRSVVNKCVKCQRAKVQPSVPFMAALSKERLADSLSFSS